MEFISQVVCSRMSVWNIRTALTFSLTSEYLLLVVKIPF